MRGFQSPEAGHGDVQDHQVGGDFLEDFQEFQAVAGFPDDFQMVVFLDNSLDALAHQHVVIGENDLASIQKGSPVCTQFET
jgi:hypothetical protein